jgi:hypothetical protein
MTAAASIRPPASARKAFGLVFAAGLLYALRALALGWAGAVPMAPALLPLGPDNYYFWEMVFILPLFVAGWLFVSTFAKVCARVLGGRGTLRTTAAALGPALAAPLVFIWVFEAGLAVLRLAGLGQPELVDIVSAPGVWQAVFIGYHLLGALGLWALTIRALAASQKLGRFKAVLAGTLTAALFLLIIVVCVR